MILEMLAADEISPTDQDALRATGYLVRNYKMLSRETWLQDTVKHTAQAFLGVTLDCARCHEHKYDPFPQEDYYRFRAFFEPHQVRTDRLPGQSDTTKDGIVRAYDADPAVPTYLFIRGDDRTPAKDKPIPPGVPVALAGPPLHVQSVALPLTAYAPDKVDYVIRETLEASARAAEQAKASLENNRKKMVETEIALAELAAECAEAQRAALEATIRVEQFEDSGGREREPTNFAALAVDATARQRWAALMEGKKNQLVAARNIQAAQRASTKAQESSAAAPTDKKLQEAAQKAAADLEKAQQKLTETESELLKAKQNSLVPPTVDYTKRATKSYPQSSTGRRSALARWIADCSNPLTTRVAINHIWNRHFGAPIVPSVFDFGAGGRKPTHPALLDWLAAELVQPTFSTGATHPPKSWSMKHIHRLIVTSATFRMASTSDGAALAADPDNRYLWRMNSRRLEAELVRDNVLWASGKLDLTMGGPEIDHQQGLTVRRRSLYFRHAAEKQMEFMKIFDAAGVNECYERRDSVVPQQALALANSELSLVHSRLLARELAAQSTNNPKSFVPAAFERVLARPATNTEIATCDEFLEAQARLFQENRGKTACADDPADGSKPSADCSLRAKENLVHALLNHNDFVTAR
jgi:hypothetical protein